MTLENFAFSIFLLTVLNTIASWWKFTVFNLEKIVGLAYQT